MERKMNGTGLAFGVALGLVLAAGGCHTNYPAVGGTSKLVTSNNPNDVAPERCMIAAVKWVLAKYPPNAVAGGPQPEIAVNLPPGLRRSYYTRIASGIGPNVRPLTQEIWDAKQIPVYHVSRIWVRENQAKVDVLRPMFELGTTPDGRPIYQLVEVHLTGPFQWRVELGRSRSEPGLTPTPDPWFLPEVDNPNEYRDWTRRQRGETPTPIIPDRPAATPSTEPAREPNGEPTAPSTEAMVPEPTPLTPEPPTIDPSRPQ